jgi:hypothetical protein
MSDIVSALRSELESSSLNIEAMEAAVIAAQERLRFANDKVDRIKGLLAIYEAEQVSLTVTVPAPPSAENALTPLVDAPRVGVRLAPNARPVSKKAQMEREVRELLAMRGRAHRLMILNHLTDRGIMGTEKNPLGHLAAFLSDNRDKFESDGAGNFKLRQRPLLEPVSSNEIEPPDASTPNGSKEVHDRADPLHGYVPEQARNPVTG